MKTPSEQDLDRVITFDDWCKRVGISPATGRRILQRGKGPRITRLSERRIGIRERDHLAWLDACVSTPQAA
jgi:predicted DNA-binding transcriptional regulator AlpA